MCGGTSGCQDQCAGTCFTVSLSRHRGCGLTGTGVGEELFLTPRREDVTLGSSNIRGCSASGSKQVQQLGLYEDCGS